MRKAASLLLSLFLLALGCAGELPSSGGPAATPAEIAEAERLIEPGFLLAEVSHLAGDPMEGRGPGTAGDRAARDYLARRLEQLGCEPAFDGEWEQPMEIVGVTSRMPDTWSFSGPDGRTLSVGFGDEYMGGSGVQRSEITIDEAEIVFVGYGIDAPEQNWDDFKGADLRGKLVLMLNDDPDWDPELFAGERKLYYGRWDYKYESAARRGAAGAIIIHTTPSAGYPWIVVRTSWSGEQFEIPAGDEPRLPFRGWLTEDASRRLVRLGGLELDDLTQAARSRDFHPVSLGVSTSLRFEAEIRRTETANVAGLLPGTDPERAREVVIFSAHHDHLGIGEPDESGDRIYNGALDNGVAMAQALGVARAISALPHRPGRSVIFLFVAAEEQGLLGSKFFTRHPPFPPGRIAANINFELGNVWGPTRDVTIFGKGKSTLEDMLERAAAEQGRTVAAEKTVRAGWFYRSDQFSFARVGVPAIWFKSGNDFIGRPAGWGEDNYARWIEERYHRPSDEVEEDWNLEGLAQDARLAFRLGLAVAERDEMPAWYSGDEFEEERLHALDEENTSENRSD
jgi:Zn-dependent M28 family amino/carboxypeptidase